MVFQISSEEFKSSILPSKSAQHAHPKDIVGRRRSLGLGKHVPFGWALGPLLLVLAWSAASAGGLIDPRSLPAPWTVVHTAFELISDGRLQENLLVSVVRVSEGFGIGVFAGVVIALIAGLSRLGEYLLDGVIQLKRSIPTLAMMPLLMLYLGIGETMKVAIIAISVFVPVYINLHAYLRAIDTRYVELADALRLSYLEFVRHIVLPGALPGLALGLRFGVTFAWLALVVVEQINATTGIGYMINLAGSYGQVNIVIVGLVVYAVLGFVSDATVRFVEKKGLVVAANAIELNSIPIVHVRNLVRGFSGRGVLNGLDFDIRKGEFVALLGRSGSGKSTLLRALAGFDHGVAGFGELRVPDELSVVFQDARLLPWKRVLDNVTLGLSGPGLRERAVEVLGEVELGGRELAWPHELSGGEQQRVALARALVRTPELLLADEPFSALDALTRIKMHDLLLRLCERYRPAVLLVTHDVDEAIKLADRIVVLEAGKLATDIDIDRWQRGESENRLRNLRANLLRQMGVLSQDERKKGARLG